MSKILTPFSTRGVNNALPIPSVLAGNAFTPFSHIASIASAAAVGDAGGGGGVVVAVAAATTSAALPRHAANTPAVSIAVVPSRRNVRRVVSDIRKCSQKKVAPVSASEGSQPV